MPEDNDERDIIDEDLFEDIEPEEMYQLLQEEKEKLKEKRKMKPEKKEPIFPRWVYALIVFALFLNAIALLPRTFSIPAIDFLITSARLSVDQDVRTYKEAVVVIQTSDGRGTGFGITDDGYIVTNHHVVEGDEDVIVNYPEEGLFNGTVISSDAEVDLALVKVNGADLPHLPLADRAIFEDKMEILFIGNPLRFNGIANEGEWIGSMSSSGLSVDVMMLDAPVYRGNSGSPVIDDDGNVIGVIYATTKNATHGKLGLAVPIEHIERILIDELKSAP